MALKHVLRLAGVALVCAVVALALLPPSTDRTMWDYFNYRTSSATDERYRLRILLRKSVAEWQTASRRDSVLKRLHAAGTAAQSPPRVLVDTSISKEIGELAVRAIGSSWEKTAISTPKSRVALVVLRDSFPDTEGTRGTGEEFIIPAAGDTTVDCVSVVLLHDISNNRRAVQRYLSGNSPRVALFGPCAFYAAFGTPGPRIAAWLESRQYDLAMRPDWSSTSFTEAPMRFRSRRGNSNLFNIFGSGSDIGGRSLIERNCWLGNIAACETVALSAIPDSALAHKVRAVYVEENGFEYHAWDDAYREYLADMRRDLGAEKFAKFWTSNEEPGVAFIDATGESIGEWTHKWVLNLYGPTVAGAKVPASYFGLGLLFVVGCVSIAAAVASQRTVG